jgi:hypothetical protein
MRTMNKPPGDDLDSLLDKLDTAKSAAGKTTNPEDAWIARFNEHRSKVIRPSLEALGKAIEARGHDFLVVEREFRRGNRAVPDEGQIRIDIYLNDEKSRTKINADRRPGLGFVTKHKSQTVQVMISDITSRGGNESKVAEIPLEKLDEAYIKEKFVALFKRLVAK